MRISAWPSGDETVACPAKAEPAAAAQHNAATAANSIVCVFMWESSFPSRCELKFDRLAAEAHGLRLHAAAGARWHQPHVQRALRGHVGETAFARADAQRPPRIVPGERDGGVLALLVAIGLAVVLVEGEAAVGAGVDADLVGRVRLLVDVLDHRAQWHDRAGAHE